MTKTSFVSDTVRRDHKYLPAIDGLRAVAVLAVIVNHFHHALMPSGYVGVDVFFVISGFVITRSLLERPNAPFGKLLIDFYARRFKRLVPALALAVVVGILLVRLFDNNPKMSTVTGLTSLFGLSNFFLYYLATDYFGPNALLNAFTHTWSLGVEEQFYVFFPAILLLGAFRAGQNLRFRLWLISSLTCLSLLSFIALYPIDQPAAYFLLPFRFWELGLGALLGIMSTNGMLERFSGFYRRWLTNVLLILLFGSFFIPETLAVTAVVVSVFLSAGLIATLWLTGPTDSGLLNNSVTLYIGRLSYSLYLWHWIVLVVSRYTIGISWMTAPFQFALMVAFAALSYHFVETPLRRRVWFERKALTVVAGFGISAAAAVVVLGSQMFEWPRYSGEKAEQNDAIVIRNTYVTELSHRVMANCRLTNAYSDDPEIMAQNVALCRASKRDDLPEFVFMGDSHAGNLAPMSDLIYDDGRAAVTHLNEVACPVPPPPSKAGRPRCHLAMKYIESLPENPDHETIIVLRNNISPKRAQGNFGPYVEALDSLVDGLLTRGYKVVYFAPAPMYYSVGPTAICSPQWFRPDWAISPQCGDGFPEPRSEALARRVEFMEVLVEMDKERPGFYLFDPFDTLCRLDEGDDYCRPLHDGKILYTDGSHLSVAGSELLFAPFMSFLEKNGLIAQHDQEAARSN